MNVKARWQRPFLLCNGDHPPGSLEVPERFSTAGKGKGQNFRMREGKEGQTVSAFSLSLTLRVFLLPFTVKSVYVRVCTLRGTGGHSEGAAWVCLGPLHCYGRAACSS